MKHPSEATLALFAGRDLGWFLRRRTSRHLARCAECRRHADRFAALRADATELGELPGIPWNRLAVEMKANIRLGLAAGECVGAVPPARSGLHLFGNARAVVAYALATLLIVAGVWIEHPAPPAAAVGSQDDTVVSVAENGIELKEGGQSLRLLHARGDKDYVNVTYSAGAQGAMRARYVDPGTGYVTINSVYAQ